MQVWVNLLMFTFWYIKGNFLALSPQVFLLHSVGTSFVLKRKPSQEPQTNDRVSMDGNMREGKEYGN